MTGRFDGIREYFSRNVRRPEWVVSVLFAFIAVLALPVSGYFDAGEPAVQQVTPGAVLDLGVQYGIDASQLIEFGTGSDEIAVHQYQSDKTAVLESLEWLTALPDGSFWLMDRPDRTAPRSRMRMFDTTGKVRKEFYLPEGAAYIAAAPDRSLWVDFATGTGTNEYVRHYDADGGLLREYALLPGIFARSVSVAPTGECWVQVEEAQVDQDTNAVNYKSFLVPVAVGESLEPPEDPLAGTVEGNFIGHDGRLYSLTMRTITSEEIAEESSATVTATSPDGEVETYELPPGYRPFAADSQGRLFAEPFGYDPDDSWYRHSIGDAVFTASPVRVYTPAGEYSRFEVDQPMSLIQAIPPVDVMPGGDAWCVTREKDGFRVTRTVPGEPTRPLDSRGTEPELTVVAGMAPSTADPYRAADPQQKDVMRLVYSGLVRFDSALKAVPDLAETVPRIGDGISADGLIVTYKLRGDVMWHDGVPVTGQDVVATWKHLSSPSVAPHVQPFPGFDVISAVTAEGNTVKVQLREPFGAAAETFFPYVLPAHLLPEVRGASNAALWVAPVGSGPYKLVRWEEDGLWQLEAHDASPRGLVSVRRLDVRYAVDESALAAFQQSRVPALWQWPDYFSLQSVRRDTVGSIVHVPTGRWVGIVVDPDDPRLSPRSVRVSYVSTYPAQELRDGILPVAAGDIAPRLYVRSEPSSATAAPGPIIPPIETRDEFNYGCGERSGWPEISIQQLNEVVDTWRAAGLPAIRAQETDFYDSWSEVGVLSRDRFAISAGVFDGFLDPGWGGVFDSTDKPGLNNPWGRGFGGSQDPSIPSLYAQARAEYDSEKRAAIGRQLEEAVIDDALMVFDRSEYRDAVVLGAIDGYQPAPYPAGDFWNVEAWQPTLEAPR